MCVCVCGLSKLNITDFSQWHNLFATNVFVFFFFSIINCFVFFSFLNSVHNCFHTFSNKFFFVCFFILSFKFVIHSSHALCYRYFLMRYHLRIYSNKHSPSTKSVFVYSKKLELFPLGFHFKQPIPKKIYRRF